MNIISNLTNNTNIIDEDSDNITFYNGNYTMTRDFAELDKFISTSSKSKELNFLINQYLKNQNISVLTNNTIDNIIPNRKDNKLD